MRFFLFLLVLVISFGVFSPVASAGDVDTAFRFQSFTSGRGRTFSAVTAGDRCGHVDRFQSFRSPAQSQFFFRETTEVKRRGLFGGRRETERTETFFLR